MAKIKNLEGLTVDDVNRELDNGAKFVMYEYCISLILMSTKRTSNIYFIKSGESAAKKGLSFTLLTLILGWWGIPWGPIFTIAAVTTNVMGGKDVTQDVLNSFNGQAEAA